MENPEKLSTLDTKYTGHRTTRSNTDPTKQYYVTNSFSTTEKTYTQHCVVFNFLLLQTKFCTD